MRCQQTATAVMPCTSNPEVLQSCSRHCGASRRAFPDTPYYTCGLGLSKNMPGTWRYPPPPPHHATPHTIISHEFHKLDVFFVILRPREGGGGQHQHARTPPHAHLVHQHLEELLERLRRGRQHLLLAAGGSQRGRQRSALSAPRCRHTPLRTCTCCRCAAACAPAYAGGGGHTRTAAARRDALQCSPRAARRQAAASRGGHVRVRGNARR